ncbi:MAG TPA: dTDP-4-dehydrorhamnose reductase [Candidatus Udaeobacter sp.]|jgi:dTDP-4-dehydrorhamnose reductase|nr:dTDP-4-dehydrorhamnose reductase [Candidatus Udaeobacter sp.]
MKIVILGAGGRLGAALMREYREKYDLAGFNHAQLDLVNLDDARGKLGGMNFDVLINAAAFTNVDACETERDRAFRINAEAPNILAQICNEKDAKLIHFSTDYVFDGEKRAPYTEDDQANPISAYGESKLAGERNVLAAGDSNLVLRVSWVFGPDRPSFIDAMIKRAQEDEKIDAISDKFSTPTYTHDIARMLPQFFDRGVAGGLLHFANTGKCSWQEYAQWALDCCRDAGISLKATRVGALTLKDMSSWLARRPVYSVLSTAKYMVLTSSTPRAWREAVNEYITRFYSKK